MNEKTIEWLFKQLKGFTLKQIRSDLQDAQPSTRDQAADLYDISVILRKELDSRQ